MLLRPTCHSVTPDWVWRGVTTTSLPREQSPLSVFLSASPLATILKLPQVSPVCPGTSPWQPCSCPQADTCPLFTGDPVIKRFLDWDKNLRISDKVRCIPALPSILGRGELPEPAAPPPARCLSPLPCGDPGFLAEWTGRPASAWAPLGSEPKACRVVVAISTPSSLSSWGLPFAPAYQRPC